MKENEKNRTMNSTRRKQNKHLLRERVNKHNKQNLKRKEFVNILGYVMRESRIWIN